MASALVVETSVDNNSPSQDSSHPDDLFNQGMLFFGCSYFISHYVYSRAKVPGFVTSPERCNNLPDSFWYLCLLTKQEPDIKRSTLRQRT